MLFNSLAFAKFLVLSLGVYYVLPSTLRKPALLVISYAFYAWWNVSYLFLLIIATIIAYIVGLLIEHSKTESGKKRVLAISLTLLLGIFVIFKYSGFLGILVRSLELANGGAGFFETILIFRSEIYSIKE